MTIHALLVAVLALLPHSMTRSRDATAIVGAIEQATGEDAARGYADAPLEAATMLLFARDESGLRLHPKPQSWDSKAHRVCGPWQLACTFVEAHPSPVDQAREWTRLVHSCGLSCVSPDANHARQRLVAAWGLVGRVTFSTMIVSRR